MPNQREGAPVLDQEKNPLYQACKKMRGSEARKEPSIAETEVAVSQMSWQHHSIAVTCR